MSLEREYVHPAPRPGLVLALMAAAHAVIHAQGALMPLVYANVSVQFGLTAASIGLIIGFTDVVGGLAQVLYGWLTRMFSRVSLLSAGYTVLGFSLIVAGFAQNAQQFALALCGARLGGSPQHPLGNALISDHVEHTRRGLAISTHSAGANLGAIAVPFLGAWTIATLGWSVALAIMGLPALIMGVVTRVLLRDDRRHSSRRLAARAPVSAFLRREMVTLIAVATVAAGGRGLLVAPFVLLYMTGPLGIDSGTVTILYTLLLVGSIVGPIVAGFLSDRVDRRAVVILYYLISAISILGFAAAGSDLRVIVIWLIPFGMAVFSESPILQSILADRTEPGEREMAFSVFFAVTFGVGAIWAIVLGVLISQAGFSAGFVTMAASYVVAAVLMISMPRIRNRDSNSGSSHLHR
jgi:MFS family permease